ncbi:SDR family oxidoreductase [Acuticoccus mangrovi]|uniref:SDR family oxidoreductase n=1 Tax=Acuticoccus mangrovi TaxID=2796142 RepID=A0A934IPB8_9HYPH|nr:SDR family oxidoreductase [Acuticoccus mangrovi]MBJ3776181.1 SDR family oxidoreductase [Acuticoccus mangrovi]
MHLNLSHRVAVITGGASGIGAACAHLFAEAGALVVTIDTSDAPAPPGVALALTGDVGNEDDVLTNADEIMDRFGRVDVLVTAAAFSTGTTVPDTALTDWEAVMRTNVTGTFLWARAAVKAMGRSGGGSIIMIASQLALAGGRSNAAYIASKGAVVSLAKTMALDHAADHIRVNTLVPGAIETPLLARSFARTGDAERARERSTARHPMGRLGRPDEIARAALFLASDASSFTTGSCLMADGGWLAG